MKVTAKGIIDDMLKKMSMTARVGIEKGEWTEEECLEFIKEQGNKYIDKYLNMDEERFALLAFAYLARTELEIKREMLRRERIMEELEDEDD